MHYPQLCYASLFEHFLAYFNWSWVGQSPTQDEALISTPDTLPIAHFNPLRSSLVTVIGPGEYAFLQNNPLAPLNTQLLILTNSLEKMQQLSSPFTLTTDSDSLELVSQLSPFLQRHLGPQITRHGVFLDIFGQGVLILGPPGAGKSDCALALIERGHRLIADDAPRFYQAGSGEIKGFCPPAFCGILASRALGFIDVKQHYGPLAYLPEKKLSLILVLDPALPNTQRDYLPLRPKLETEVFFKVPLPRIHVPLSFSKNIAIILENAVKLAFSSQSPLIERLLSPCD